MKFSHYSLLLAMHCGLSAHAAEPNVSPTPKDGLAAAPSAETPAEYQDRMKWFNDARFGMFIHLGLYSEAAGNFKGKPIGSLGEWMQSTGTIPAAEYREELLPKFNPVKYDPESWVVAAKSAGIKYIVITSKHHDGFGLWDSKLTDWDVGSSPYKKDLLKPLADACKKHGIKFCLYHSIMDWSHPEYGEKQPWRGNASNPNPDMEKFTAYLKGQLKELVDAYHPGILWFDGEWESAWTHERGVDLYQYLRKLDPKLIINNRVDKGRAGMQGHTTDAKFKGDYGTPEQEIPAIGFGEGVAWESCMTMNDTWGFKSADQNWKSTETLVRNLIDVASKGGNYLLNVGPTGEGEIPPVSLERLAAIGQWMKVNGESIHGTSASLFPRVSWKGRSTTRIAPDGTSTIYMHVFDKPDKGETLLRGLQTKPETARILGTKTDLKISGNPGKFMIQLPDAGLDPIATVVALTFKSKPLVERTFIEPDETGAVELPYNEATLHGSLRIENNHIGWWINDNDHVSWQAMIPEGIYQVLIDGSCASGGSEMKLTSGSAEVPVSIPVTGSWDTFTQIDAGTIQITGKGPVDLSLRGVSRKGEGFINLRSIRLTKKP